MHVLRNLCLVLCLTFVGGCHVGFLGRRTSECNCPTDIRQTMCWTVGEDAVFHCPCGPSAQYFGYKPTCWNAFPAPGAIWRDEHCGPLSAGCDVDVHYSEPDLQPTYEPIPRPEKSGSPGEEPVPTTLEAGSGWKHLDSQHTVGRNIADSVQPPPHRSSGPITSRAPAPTASVVPHASFSRQPTVVATEDFVPDWAGEPAPQATFRLTSPSNAEQALSHAGVPSHPQHAPRESVGQQSNASLQRLPSEGREPDSSGSHDGLSSLPLNRGFELSPGASLEKLSRDIQAVIDGESRPAAAGQ